MVVAATGHPDRADDRTYRIGQLDGAGSIHLFPFLTVYVKFQ